MNFAPAYHLRTNKAVERMLFLELLHQLDRVLGELRATSISNYTYVGLGGPYLEDFHLIHSTFGNRKMISLEVQEDVLTRQAINQPCSQITLTNQSTRDYIDDLRLGRTPSIVWLDYSSQQWIEQLVECLDLIPKLAPMSILKVTLTGNTRTLGKNPTERAQRLSEMFADYGPFETGDVKPERICGTIFRILRRSISDAAPDTQLRAVRSLASYEYNDGTPVLTTTIVVGPIAKVEKVTDAIHQWPFSAVNWSQPRMINIPPLSLREKLAVDRLLPHAHPRTVINKLNLRFADKYEDSIAAMANYVELYRFVPYFVRMAV
jgi:hypothetical protein